MTTVTQLIALDAGSLLVPASDHVPGVPGIRRMLFPAFLIEHPSGFVLFDTGLGDAAYDDPGYFGSATGREPTFAPEQRVDRQLARLGVLPKHVRHVVLSHSHSDHVGGLLHFPDTDVFIGPGELEWAHRLPEGASPFVRWREQLAPAARFAWHTASRPQHDVFGDGSLVLIHTPGHTPGHLSMVVRLPSRTVVLTGDATHFREGIEQRRPDPHDWDNTAALKSMNRLSALADEGAELWIAHEPADWEHFGAPGRIT